MKGTQCPGLDFETCLDCIKGKQTNKSKKGATRSKHLLEIIHTYICCPNMDWSDSKYFITFIDDYSRYMYRACFVLRTKCWKPLRYSRPK